jgi:predicted enzyme related to lactoylglutathione lyase
MNATIRTVIYPVTDLAQAKAVFAAVLGTQPVMDESYYVQFNADRQEIGLDPNGASKGLTGPVPYWQVQDIHATVQRLLDAGATLQEPVHDVGGGGRLVATLSDGAGNPIGLLQQN